MTTKYTMDWSPYGETTVCPVCGTETTHTVDHEALSTWEQRHAAYLDYAKTFPDADEVSFQAGFVCGTRHTARRQHGKQTRR
jgi:hypothetical protein